MCALFAQRLKRGLQPRRGESAPTQQHEMPRALLHQPMRRGQAEAGQAAGEQIAGVGVQAQIGCRLRGLDLRGARAQVDDELADVAALLHVPQRVDDAICRKRGVGQGGEALLRELLHDFAKHAGGQVGAQRHELVGIEAEVADVVAEGTQADLRVFVKVALAQFDKTTKRAHGAQIALDGLPG